MPAVSIRLFGRLSAHCAQAVMVLETRKVQELLSYLLLYRQRPHARETLASLLWADCPAAQSKSYLRKTLWQLQAALDVSNEAMPRLLTLEDEWVQVNPQAEMWLDVADFEQAQAQTQGLRGRALDTDQAERLRQAVDLYRGELLEGWYYDWCLFERERLQQTYLAMLDKLMGYCETHTAYEEGVMYGTRILSCDQARERTHQRLMRLHYLAGNRTEALRQYERCAAALARDLDVQPDEHTLALYQHIRANKPLPPGLPLHAPAPATADASPSLHDMLDRLKQVQSSLDAAQRQIQHDIQAIERALRR